MSRCNIKNNMINNDPHMFYRWITRKYGFFTQQRRELPILFYLRFLFSRLTTINPQLRNQVYQSNRQFYLKFNLFFRESKSHSKAFHRPAIFPAAVGKDFIYLPGCCDLQNPGIIESFKLNPYHVSSRKDTISSFRAINRRKTEPNRAFTAGRNSEKNFDRFLGRTQSEGIRKLTQSSNYISKKICFFNKPGNKGIKSQPEDTNVDQEKSVMVNVPTQGFRENGIPELLQHPPKRSVLEKEELQTLSKGKPEKFAGNVKVNSEYLSGSSGSSRQQNFDLDRLTDQVYRLLERKIRIEKEMRGW